MEISNPEDYIVTSNSCNQAIVRLTSFASVLFRSEIPVLSVWNQLPDTGLETITTKKRVLLMPQMFRLLDTDKSLSSPDTNPNKFIFIKNPTLASFLMLTFPDHKRSLNWISISISSCIYQSTFLSRFSQLLQPLLAIPKNTHSSASVLSVSLVR